MAQVVVRGIPVAWDNEKLKEHFEDRFEAVESARLARTIDGKPRAYFRHPLTLLATLD